MTRVVRCGFRRWSAVRGCHETPGRKQHARNREAARRVLLQARKTMLPLVAFGALVFGGGGYPNGDAPSSASQRDGESSPIRLSVGETGSLKQVVLTGPKRVAKPHDRESRFVIRIDAVYPHGTDWRYDLSFYGLEPGRYNVVDYLQAESGESAGGAKPLWVEVYSVLPRTKNTPHALEFQPTPRPGRYRELAVVAGVFWVIGLIALIWGGRVRRRRQEEAARRRVTLADRLRPLVRRAEQGELTTAERAELERLLISYWQRRLKLEAIPPAEMMARLREDEQAGPLLRQLEAWLHRPQPQPPQDLDELLRPYRDVADPEAD